MRKMYKFIFSSKIQGAVLGNIQTQLDEIFLLFISFDGLPMLLKQIFSSEQIKYFKILFSLCINEDKISKLLVINHILHNALNCRI